MEAPKRYGMVVGLKDDKIEEYLRLHRAVPDPVEATMRRANFRNTTIYIHRLPDGKHYLFMYCEYAGSDFDADVAEMQKCPDSRAWWGQTGPCQQPLPDEPEGGTWSLMTEVVHHP